MRRSSLDNIDIGIEREISSQFDDVKLVAGSIDDVIRVSAAIENGSLEAAADIAGDIQTVGAIAGDVVVVSENMDNIQGILDNIVDVQNAEENALIATAKAAEALVSAATATSQASIATNKATEAAVSATNALASENSAKISEDEALISATNASASEAIALASKNSAIASASTATNKASEASTSATSASVSAVSALASKVSAEISATTATNKASEALSSANVASSQAGIATTKASEASSSASSALVSENKAEKWASELEDVEVEPGEYSAKHWASKAQGFAEGDSANIGYDNVGSGLAATNVQDAIDELDESIDDLTANTYTKTEVRESLPNIGLDLTAGVVVATGQIAWNADEGTADLGLSNGSTLQIGQENVRTIRNATASTITNGTLCMFDGTIGNSGRIKVKPFTAGFNEAMYLYGVATQNITAESDGIITIEGKVRGMNTSGSSVGEIWNDEDILYAKPNDNGRMTNVVPADNELKLVVATVVKAHATNGTLEIRFTPMNENLYYTKVQNDILLSNKVPLNSDFILDLGEI